MICPKCKFSQPDDYYCANCGVNVEKYDQKRKRKRYLVGVATTLILLTAFLLTVYFTPSHRTREAKKAGKAPTEVEVDEKHKSVSGYAVTQANEGASKSESDLAIQKGVESELESSMPGEMQARVPGSEKRTPQMETEGQTEPSSDNGGKGTLTAKGWFEKGVRLDDDSDTETAFYQKAIELDPKFAPAYYRLGAIYFRQANYDLAEQQFARFLEYASEADRQAYNLDLYYSPDYLERVLSETKTEESPLKEAEKEMKGSSTSMEAVEEVEIETTQEVETIIRFTSAKGQMIIPVLLNGSLRADMLFDTGAEITVLSTELAQNLGLLEEESKPIRLGTIASDLQASLVKLDAIQVGEFIKNDFSVAVTDLDTSKEEKFDGILGMDFLSSYAIQVDKGKSWIVLTSSDRNNL